ncbi:MAG: HAD hydrolase-like protein [Clostridia bacterium]|nr:HAD hydrolase-like protein [Clostridia bacterium]
MVSKYKYCLFDLDGTLTDPAPGITGSVEYALERFGIRVANRSELNKFIGPPLVYSFKTYFGFSDEQAKQAVVYYRERFSAGGLYENEIYPGRAELLENIKEGGGRVILATSKPEEFAEKILAHFDILKYFDFVAGNTLEETRPEKRQVIEHILSSRPDISPENAIMVGDREYDVLAAKEFSLPSVGVLFGYGSLEELESAGADMLAKDIAELRALLMEA